MVTTGNYLIERLPRKDRLRLLGRSERVALVEAAVLQRAGESIRHAYFPCEGGISLQIEMLGRAALEVGLVGSEGMTGALLALGRYNDPQRASVRTPGWAIRIGHEGFRRELHDSVALRRLVYGYLHFQLARQAGMIGCVHFHRIGPRLASWLLRSQDCAQADAFPATQALMASMLGVRRVSITIAAGAMQGDGLIRYHRGNFEVLDRPGLEAMACVCYESGRVAYDHALS